MTDHAMLSDECAEQAIVQRLFRASMELHSALSLVCEERTAVLLRRAIWQLDESIRQVQGGMLALSPPAGRALVPGAAWRRLRLPAARQTDGPATR